MRLILLKRDKHIVEEYKKLSEIKTPRGNLKFSNEYIIETISEKFFLAEFTINKIITKTKQNDKNRNIKRKR